MNTSICGITLKAICLVNFLAAVVGRVVDRLGLIPQLVHRLFARARNGLVGADNNALDRRAVVQRLQRHNHLRGRAVRVRDDVLLGIAVNRLWVHLGHDQRHVGIVAVKRRVIDHDAAGLGSLGRVFLRGVRADSKQRHIPAREIKRVQVLRLQGLVAKAHFRPQRFAAGQGGDLRPRELALGQDVQHFVAHVTCGTNDDDIITHLLLP